MTNPTIDPVDHAHHAAPEQAPATGTSRRRFLAAGATTLTAAALGSGGWLAAAGSTRAQATAPGPKARVVVVGGG
jgi:ferric-dicitrate binding protein FerR (iron transport regulator)